MSLSNIDSVRAKATDTPISELAPAPLRNHLASLDGLRALSIFFVLLAHSSPGEGDILTYYGHLGVSIFFVISGTLITWLMIREREETGSLSLPDFYIRRALRILPVYWLLILCVIALNSTHIIEITWPDILRAFTFTHNYPPGKAISPDYAWWLHHTWSLSLEEQFYLVWPSLFAFLPRRISKYLAALLAMSGPILRVANYYLFPSLRGEEGGMFHTRIDILMMGCVLAFLLSSPTWVAKLKKVSAGPVLIACCAFLVVVEPLTVTRYKPHTIAHAIVGAGVPTLEAALIAVCILLLVVKRSGVAYNVFNRPILTHFGKLSYSLYLWQQLFLGSAIGSNSLSLLWRLPCIYLISICSFNFLEMPFLKLRKRFRRVLSE